jgi:hypothetical protein
MTQPPAESQPPKLTPPTPAVDVQLRRHSWEAYSVIVATVVGLLSLAVSAYTAYTLHVQTRAQVFPYLQVIDLGEQHRLAVYNKGVGPAFVKSMRVDFDDKPVRTWREFFDAAGVKLVHDFAYSNVNHVPIAANETLPALIFHDAGDFAAYQAVAGKRFRITLCYCSVLDECWSMRAADDLPPQPLRTSSCVADPATDFTQ